MRKIALFIVLLFLASPALADEGYLDAVRDIPLMQGFEEIPAETFVFDKPNGRIVEAVASGASDIARVRDFYARVLPQLGWTPQANDSYVRESESLRLTFDAKKGVTHVRFSLNPL